MKKRTKWILAIAVVLLLIGGIILGNYLLSVKKYQDTIANTSYQNTDISQLPDGTYIGEYDVNFIYAKGSVTVKDGHITEIDLMEHRHERGAAAEGIEQRIVEQQKIDVDTVSGATNSSTVIKKAVDKALEGGIN